MVSALARVCCCRARGLIITTAVLGAVLLTIGLSSQPLIKSVVRSQIKSTVTMDSPSAELFDVWSGNTEIPEFMTYYVFNVTNPWQVQYNYSRPLLQLVGPFTYTEVNKKFAFNWTADGTRVAYKYNRTFIPLSTPCPPGTSTDTLEPPECTLDDSQELTVGNIPLMGFVEKIMSIGKKEATEIDLGKAVDDILKDIDPKHKETLFMTRPAHEIIWGYDDFILLELENIFVKLAKRWKAFEKVPIQNPYISLQLNNSVNISSQFSAINTGKDDSTQAFSYEEWAGHEGSLNVWQGCDDSEQGRLYRAQGNMINGTEGLQFQPLLEDDTILPVYSQDILRSAVLVPTSSVTIKGINLRRYSISHSAMLNATEYPPNCAFGNYGPSGVMNLSDAEGGPVFASKPMFFQADPLYRQWIVTDNLPTPNAEKHDTFLDIEPWTGACMHAHQRLQINTQFRQIKEVTVVANLNPNGFYLPIAWADEWAYVSDDLADQWKSEVGLALNVAAVMQTAGIAAGLGLMGVALLAIGVTAWRVRRAGAATESTALLKDSVNSEY